MADIGSERLRRQRIQSPVATPVESVATLGAIQGQDFGGALWSIGLRLGPGLATERIVEESIAPGKLLRSWLWRGTLHVVAAADIRWMLELIGARSLQTMERRHRELELDEAVFTKCRLLLAEALREERQMKRTKVLEALLRGGIDPSGQRGYHILWRMSQEGLVCFGKRAGKQPTIALLDDWAPPAKPMAREAALEMLARRYFSSRGPATLADFTYWSGLAAADARAALEAIAPECARETITGSEYWYLEYTAPASDVEQAHLLPGFDEFLLGYKDRAAVLDPRHASKICPGGNGIFLPTLIIDGHARGIWKRQIKTRSVAISIAPFGRLTRKEKDAIAIAADRFAAYVERPAAVVDFQ